MQQIKASETKHKTKGKGQEDKQRLQSNTQNNTNPTKNQGISQVLRKVSSSCVISGTRDITK